jgi:hypothetical protein
MSFPIFVLLEGIACAILACMRSVLPDMPVSRHFIQHCAACRQPEVPNRVPDNSGDIIVKGVASIQHIFLGMHPKTASQTCTSEQA